MEPLLIGHLKDIMTLTRCLSPQQLLQLKQCLVLKICADIKDLYSLTRRQGIIWKPLVNVRETLAIVEIQET